MKRGSFNYFTFTMLVFVLIITTSCVYRGAFTEVRERPIEPKEPALHDRDGGTVISTWKQGHEPINRIIPKGSAVFFSSGSENPDAIIVAQKNVPVIIELEDDPVTVYQRKVVGADVERYNLQLVQQQERIQYMIRDISSDESPLSFTYVFNGITALIDADDVEYLKQIPGVKEVHLDTKVEALLDESVPLIRAPLVWQQYDQQGRNITGQGVVVAIIDTGVDYTHPDLGGCLGPTCKVIGGYDFVNGDNDPFDDHGHGTHVAGTIAARGVVTGVAPDAKLLAYKVLNADGSGSSSTIMAGIDRAVRDGAHIISISLGGYGYSDDPMSRAVNNAVDSGVFAAVAVGNSGPTGNEACRHISTLGEWYFAICSPGNAEKALSVGASTKNDTMAGFSSRGFALYSNGQLSFIKPEIVAPGVSINAPVPRGTCALCRPTGYIAISGTSMATPHVAGVAALLKQAHPLWTPSEIKSAIVTSATDIGHTPIERGGGRVDAYAAYTQSSLLSPAAQILGIDVLPDTEIFTRTLIFQLRNRGLQRQTYTLQPQFDPSVSLEVTPSPITVEPNEAATVTLRVTVDNARLADGIYHGKLDIMNQRGSVPLSFIKTKVVILQLGPWHYITSVLNATNYYFGSFVAELDVETRNLTLYLRPGEYHLMSFFNGIPSWFPRQRTPTFRPWTGVLNKFSFTGQTTPVIPVHKEQANRLLNVTVLDRNNNTLDALQPCNGINYTATCHQFYYYAFILNGVQMVGAALAEYPTQYFFYNDAPDWSMAHTESIFTPEPAAYIPRYLVKPLQGNLALLLQPQAQLTLLYDEPHREDLARMLSLSWSEIYTNSTQMISYLGRFRHFGRELAGHNFERIYTTPTTELAQGTPLERSNGRLMFVYITKGEDAAQTLFATPIFAFSNATDVEFLTISGILTGDLLIPLPTAFALYNKIYDLRAALTRFTGRMTSGLDWLTVRGYLQLYQFLKQNNIYQVYDNQTFRYALYGPDGSMRTQGYYNDFLNFGLPLMSIGRNSIALSADGYDKVRERPARFEVNMTVADTARQPQGGDVNLPFVTFVKIIADNAYVDNVIPPTATSSVIMKATDLEGRIAGQIVSFRSSGAPWSTVLVQLGELYDTANLPALAEGDYDLRYEAVDQAGNSIVYTWSPGFRVSSSASPPVLNETSVCGNGICEPDENPLTCFSDCGCGNNIPNTGEECGEPRLPECPPPSTCSGCRCVYGAPSSCIRPTSNMTLYTNVTFCNGEYYVENITIGNSLVQSVDCNGAVLRGGYGYGRNTREAFTIDGVDGLLIKNCVFTNYDPAIYTGVTHGGGAPANNIELVANMFLSNLESIRILTDTPSASRNVVNDNIFFNDSSFTLINENSEHSTYTGNTFIDNGGYSFHQALDGGHSVWSQMPRGGNYWSDYAGADADLDGFGDTPYPIRNFTSLPGENFDYAPLMNPNMLYINDTARIGQILSVAIRYPPSAGQRYHLLVSLGIRPPLVLPNGRVLYLTPDAVFFTSLLNPTLFMRNAQGTLDSYGRAVVDVVIPAEQTLVGLQLYLVAITLGSSNEITGVSHTAQVIIS